MVTIRATTIVQAPIERCFRLAVSIDLQKAAARHQAIAGVTAGLIGPGQTVTWQSRRLGRKIENQSLIEVWRPYNYFRDIMIAGSFDSYEHDHHFAPLNDGTRIRDYIRFKVSGRLGRFAEKFFMRKSVEAMLRKRNALIKQAAESDKWHEFLDAQPALDMHVFQAPFAVLLQNADSIYAD
jgi:ligand-binding SRPBCC domain-containing protein